MNCTNRFAKVLPAVLVAAALFLVASCDDFLNETGPIGSLNSETFYQTPEDFRLAIYASYRRQLDLYYEQFGTGWYDTILLPSDDLRSPPTAPDDLDDFNWQSTNGNFDVFWRQSYEGISEANLVLQQLPESPLDEATKNEFRGEARFLRGYYHFLLARLFGNPPAVRSYLAGSLDSINVGNADQEPQAVWDLIEADFRFAANNLPATREADNTGRVVSGTAAGYLGKANLFRAQWFGDDSHYEEAIGAFEQVVNGGGYALMEVFEENFEIPTENNQESLFEVQHTAGGNGFTNPWLNPDFGAVAGGGNARHIQQGASTGEDGDGVTAPGANGQGYGDLHPTRSIRATFEDYGSDGDKNDPRRFSTYFLQDEVYSPESCTIPAEDGEGEVTLEPCLYQEGFGYTGATPAKYMRPFEFLEQAPLFTNNERLMRYADVLLMLAEAELLGNGNASRAAELVNQVRERARNNYDFACSEGALYLGCDEDRESVEVVPPVDAANLTHETIRHERRLELAFEGHRYHDLVRWHHAGLIAIPNDIDFGSDVANANWTEQNLLRPIPQTRIDNNPNLVQNERY